MEAERKAKLGQRWVCFSCASRFYDLNKPEPVCPKCGADQRESPALAEKKRPRRSASRKKATSARKIAPRLLEDDDGGRSRNRFGSEDDASLQGGEDVPEIELDGDTEIVELEVEED